MNKSDKFVISAAFMTLLYGLQIIISHSWGMDHDNYTKKFEELLNKATLEFKDWVEN